MHLRKLLIFIVISLASGACASTNSFGSPTITPTLADPHHHVVDVNNNSLGPQNINGFKISKATVDPGQKKDDLILNQSKTLQAFYTCERECRIFFEELSTGEVYEITAPSFLPSRPFSDLVWVTDRTLVFDQWSQPHYGVHYAIDVLDQKLILASPFPDKIP